MIRLIKAAAQCPNCDRKFHQIDGTEERALRIVREAVDRHIDADHDGLIDVPADDATGLVMDAMGVSAEQAERAIQAADLLVRDGYPGTRAGVVVAASLRRGADPIADARHILALRAAVRP